MDARQSTRHPVRYILTFILIFALIYPLIVQGAKSNVPIFDMVFNPYCILSFIALAVNITLLAYVHKMKIQGDEATWLTLYAGLMTVFAFSEAMQRLAVDPMAAAFWIALGSSMGQALPPVTFLFALVYTRPTARHSSKIAFILLGILIMAFYQVHSTGLIFSYELEHIKRFPWGYNDDVGDAYLSQLIWLLGFTSATFIMLWRLYRRSASAITRKQTVFFLLGVGVPASGALTFDVVLPAFHVTIFPPMTALLSGMSAAILIYGTVRYRVLTISPSLLANSILSIMHESVIATNTKLEIQYMNAEAEKVFGKKTTKQSTLVSLFDSRSVDYFTNELRSLGASGRHVLDDLSRTDDSHDTVYMQAQVSKLHGESLIEGYLFVLSDVTELKKSYRALEIADKRLEHEKQNVEHKVLERTKELTQERARLEASINSLNAGFLMTDHNDAILMINGAARNLLFKGKESKATYTLDDIAHAFGKEFKLKHYVHACLKDGDPVTADVIQIEGRMLKLFLAPIIDSSDTKQSALGVVVLIEDITEAKILERSREEFFSIASHELRTPLTAIRGNASMMKQFYTEQLKDPDLFQMVDDIEVSSVRLIEIVNDFLDASRLEQGKIEFHNETFRIEEILENVVYEVGAVASQKSIQIYIDKTLESSPPVYADKNRIKQVVYNLVGNAMKFTSNGSITFGVITESKMLKILVTDTGAGISDENQTLLFRKFQQAGNSLLTRETSRGTGLGLYISKLMLDGMNGEIKLEHSEVGKGSTFSFTIPLATPKQIEDQTTTAAAIPPQSSDV